MYRRRCWGFPATLFTYSKFFSERANDGGGLNVSGIPCRSRPVNTSGLEPKVRKGRSINGAKAFRFTEYRGKKKHLNSQIPYEIKKPEGGCTGKFPGKADGTFSPPRPVRPPPSFA
jgi:hypothetical protein